MLFGEEVPQYSWELWIIEPTSVCKAWENLIRLALDAGDPSAFFTTFVETFICLFAAAAEAAELSAQGADCTLPNFRRSPIDVF